MIDMQEWTLGLARCLVRAADIYFGETLDEPQTPNEPRLETLTMTLVMNNDSIALLRPQGTDSKNVAVIPTGLEVTVDPPTTASVDLASDPKYAGRFSDPKYKGAFVITPLPATDPAVGIRSAVVTTRDPNTGLSTKSPIEIDPSVERSLAVSLEVLPASPPDPTTPGNKTPGNETPPQDQSGQDISAQASAAQAYEDPAAAQAAQEQTSQDSASENAAKGAST